MVAGGNKQHMTDQEADMFLSPTAYLTIFRMFVAITGMKGQKLWSLDVSTAFLEATYQEDKVYDDDFKRYLSLPYTGNFMIVLRKDISLR
mmetsp:Transcript_17299/g.29620  ORF Transcript_17299/g.29620 Transcript_17299/m.29620 type:complete len:90 (+) Transcript_17299:66-335(+)